MIKTNWLFGNLFSPKIWCWCRKGEKERRGESREGRRGWQRGRPWMLLAFSDGVLESLHLKEMLQEIGVKEQLTNVVESQRKFTACKCGCCNQSLAVSVASCPLTSSSKSQVTKWLVHSFGICSCQLHVPSYCHRQQDETSHLPKILSRLCWEASQQTMFKRQATCGCVCVMGLCPCPKVNYLFGWKYHD